MLQVEVDEVMTHTGRKLNRSRRVDEPVEGGQTATAIKKSVYQKQNNILREF